MNREMRRLQEAEERRRKKENESQTPAQRRAAAMAAKAQAPAVERKPFIRRIREYFHEVRQEMRKVTWPNREQMITFTTIVLITTTVLTLVIFGFDVLAKESVIRLLEVMR